MRIICSAIFMPDQVDKNSGSAFIVIEVTEVNLPNLIIMIKIQVTMVTLSSEGNHSYIIFVSEKEFVVVIY